MQKFYFGTGRIKSGPIWFNRRKTVEVELGTIQVQFTWELTGPRAKVESLERESPTRAVAKASRRAKEKTKVRARVFTTTKVAKLARVKVLRTMAKAKVARLTKPVLFVDSKGILPRTVGKL